MSSSSSGAVVVINVGRFSLALMMAAAAASRSPPPSPSAVLFMSTMLSQVEDVSSIADTPALWPLALCFAAHSMPSAKLKRWFSGFWCAFCGGAVDAGPTRTHENDRSQRMIAADDEKSERKMLFKAIFISRCFVPRTVGYVTSPTDDDGDDLDSSLLVLSHIRIRMLESHDRAASCHDSPAT